MKRLHWRAPGAPGTSDDERACRADRRRQGGAAESHRSTPAAAERPSAIAHTMRDWPRPASPATKTPSTLDM